MMISCNQQLPLIWMPNNADSICRKVGGKLKLKWPALHAIILQYGTRPARIAPPNTLTDSQTRFLLKVQPYLKSMTQTLKSKPYIMLHYRSITCLKTLVGSGTLYCHFAEKQPVLLHCWDIPNTFRLLIYA